jgi:uncharacterized cupin superfamily protein
VLEGELTFRYEEDGSVGTVIAGPGDAVSIPPGVGHAFSVNGPGRARYLIASTAAGIDSFFADAGEPIDHGSIPDEPPPFDRDRLLAAFAQHGLTSYTFPPGHADDRA